MVRNRQSKCHHHQHDKPTRDPNLELNLLNIKCGYCSDTVPMDSDGRSCLSLTLCRVKDVVGPYGKCEMISPSDFNVSIWYLASDEMQTLLGLLRYLVVPDAHVI